MGNAHEIFSAGRLIARQKAPYFRAMLLGLAPVETPGLGTIAVSEHGVLLWDPAAVAQWTPQQMAGGFVHEVLHLILKHMQRAKRANRDHQIDGMATDLSINPAVIDMGLELPVGVLMPEKFGFARGLTADEYYELLLKKFPPQPKPRGKGKGGEGDEDGEGGREGCPGPPKPGVGEGWCGSCHGREVPGEPPSSDGASRSTAEIDRLSRQVAEAVREHGSKGRGTVPSMLARWAEKALEPSRIPWQTKLARVTRAAVAWCMGSVDHRYDAPGRRQAGIGYGVGKPILPRLRQPVPRIAVIADTSGSMGGKELGIALSETAAILKAVGANVDFCACDAAVHGLRSVKTWQELLPLMKGGGGTDMRPAFIELLARKPRPEVIVCITDGQLGSGYPEVAPRGCKVIWVIIGSYRNNKPAPWGEVIEVDDIAADKAVGVSVTTRGKCVACARIYVWEGKPLLRNARCSRCKMLLVQHRTGDLGTIGRKWTRFVGKVPEQVREN